MHKWNRMIHGHPRAYFIFTRHIGTNSVLCLYIPGDFLIRKHFLKKRFISLQIGLNFGYVTHFYLVFKSYFPVKNDLLKTNLSRKKELQYFIKKVLES